MEELTKIKIGNFIDKKKDFEKLRYIVQVKYIAYFYIKAENKFEFTPREIKTIFEAVSLPKPKNINNLITKLEQNKIFLINKKTKTFSIARPVLKELNLEFADASANLNKIDIFYVSGEKPWTDRNEMFANLLGKLEGEIMIVDAYYGVGTFHMLKNFSQSQKVKFLTAQLGSTEDNAKIESELKHFKREFNNVELRKYSKFYELHDRYILSDNLLVWIGHGLKDFGNKECFLIAIPRMKIMEITKTLEAKFNEKWSKSNVLN